MAYKRGVKDPFLSGKMQHAMRLWGVRFLGVLCIITGIGFSFALWSYSPNDPTFLNISTGDVSNILGNVGAVFADILFLAIGAAAWVFPAAFVIWGGRLIFNIGVVGFLWRIIFVLIFACCMSVFLSLFTTPASWVYRFSLGGFSGDALLALINSIDLMDPDLWDRIVFFVIGGITFWLGCFSLGFTKYELTLLIKGCAKFFGLSLLFFWQIIIKVFIGLYQRLFNRKQRKNDPYIMNALNHSTDEKDRAKQQKTYPSNGDNSFDPKEYDDHSTGQKDVTKNRITNRIKAAIARKDIKEKTRQSSFDTINKSTPFIDTTMLGELSNDPLEPQSDLAFPHNSVQTISQVNQRKEPRISRFAPPHTVVTPPHEKTISVSKRAQKEAQPTLFVNKNENEFKSPALGLLNNAKPLISEPLSNEALRENARMLENVLDDYGVKGEIVSVRAGPVVTLYELDPAPGLKASRVIGLADDIARSMSALSARVSTVPGRSVIGIELPNAVRETVLLREILSSRDYDDGKHILPLALGKNIAGTPEVADLSKMPHLLIAGTTGSGKSVAINTMILSLLYKLSPEQCRLIMIDPKMLELSVYDDIPHLLSPVVTDPKKAVVALKWVVSEMEERYRKMSKLGVRNIAGYNSRVDDSIAKGQDFERVVQTGFDSETGEPIFETETFAPEKIPFIVVIVDEMADLMMVAGKEIEACIQRLAQMARASGIHLIMATQRPSVDVITGTIKANFPTRISFQVTSKIDSRTILGEMGAEQLLGMGDMLFMAGGGRVMRIHAPFVSDEEVEDVVTYLKTFGSPEYDSGIIKGPDDDKLSTIDSVLGLTGGNTDMDNALYDQAVAIVAKDRKCSTSYIQRKLSIGYNKAAKLVEAMEENNVVSAANHVGKREILLPGN